MQSASAPPTFALAKIQPPKPRVGLVARPVLEQSLGAALMQQRLTLLLAAAGYGKTAALTRQIRQLPEGCALAWVSSDEDDHLQRFLACLTTALEPHDVPWRVAPEGMGMLAQAGRGLRDVADELLNGLASAETPRGLIVIDDAHRIADPRVFELLELMLERLPEHWGLVIASRIEPPLSLARLRAAGDLAEFRQYELRFSEDEVRALLDSADLPTPAESARELLDRTAGWAAGLRLSLSARAGGAGRQRDTTQRHLFDYLAAEVLEDMPEELREFLLRCAILPELTAGQCARVSGMPHAAALLDEVERRGLFVSLLDADELTLRLHDLFRDFLEDRLLREFPAELPALLRRAAEGEADLSRAVGYLTRAGAWDEAARMLAERGPLMFAAGGARAVEQMLALFPASEFDAHPDLHLLRGYTGFPRFDFDLMVSAMQRAAEGFARVGRERDAAFARAYACLGMQSTGKLRTAAQQLALLRERQLEPELHAFVCFGAAWAAYAEKRAEEVAPLFAEMLAALEQVPSLEVWDRCFFCSLLIGLPGMVPLLERFAHGAARVAGDAPSPLRAGMLHTRTWLALLQGRLDEADDWLARADEDCRWLGRPRSLMTENWMAHTLLDAVRGRGEASFAAAWLNRRDIEEHSMSSNRRTHEYELLFTFARAAWILGDEAQLREVDAALQRTGNAFEWLAADDDRRFGRAFIALADGRLAEAAALLESLADPVERSCFCPATQARVMWADTLCRLGRHDAAAAALKPWIASARRSGEVGGALLCGPVILKRLSTADWGGRLDADERAFVSGLGAIARGQPAAIPAFAGSRPAPLDSVARPAGGAGLAALSEREREVLERMAAGDSNKLIARAFDLSPHTVKRHVANILGKLAVDTRGQAAARWREQG